MHRFRTRAGVAALAVALLATGCKWTGWGNTASIDVAHTARTWLVTHQQADGGFEVSGFPGFETPDAILAIAEDAQLQEAWSTTQARAAVAAVKKNGKSALDAIDDFADGPLTAGQAAKLIVLVAQPLGYDLRSFDPQNDGTKRDLVAAVDAGRTADGGYGAFNATLYATLALRLAGRTADPATVALIRAGRQSSGGWGFTGDGTATDADVDTTSLAIQALVAAGAPATDPDLTKGVVYLAEQHQADGAWPSFGADDPNSTATGIIALAAIGENPSASCWRGRAVPALAGTPYRTPVSWLRKQLAPDGHIASPNDAYPPVNTFATTQSIEAFRRGWLPVAWLPQRSCP
jgi:hypothetical protein